MFVNDSNSYTQDINYEIHYFIPLLMIDTKPKTFLQYLIPY